MTMAASAWWGMTALVLFGADEVAPIDLGKLESDIKPFVSTYCLECHAGEDAQGGVKLDELPPAENFVREPDRWRRVVGQIRAKGMPPEDAKQPADEERASVVQWLNHAASNVDCGEPQPPGRPTLRRLNRVEYNNTVRDLLGVEARPADLFPADDVGDGFDNIGDVLSISPILMEKYLAAAEDLAKQAVVLPIDLDPIQVRMEGEKSRSNAGGGSSDNGTTQRMAKNGELYKTGIFFPIDGEYAFELRAYGEQAGDEPVKAALQIDKADPIEIVVPATASEPGVYKIQTHVKLGKHKIAIRFLNDFFHAETSADRNLVVDYLEITGPTKFEEPPPPASHAKIIFRPIRPESKDEDRREILERLARRAYRRPVSNEEIARLLAIAKLADESNEPVERSIQLAIQAVLVSPHFLFRVESDPAEGIERPLNDHELAARLSYFLWSSMPDESLSERADRGELQNEEVLRAEIDRMLADDRALAFVESFAGQWLQLRNLEIRQPDSERFPNFDEKLRTAMKRETELFFASVLRERRDIADFLKADYTFVNERLAKHYGIEGVTGDEFQRVAVADKPRGGILTQASILTLTSDPTRTSPVKRGKWVMETILGSPPPVPPPDVPELDKQKLTGTLRQRMEQHRQNPACATCHDEMDPLGFGMENFDAIGSWREKDGDYPIDASGKLPDGSSFAGAKELAGILAQRKEELIRALTTKMLTYALGRSLEYYDTCEIREISARVMADGGKLSTLVWEVVRSRPFRMRSAPVKG